MFQAENIKNGQKAIMTHTEDFLFFFFFKSNDYSFHSWYFFVLDFAGCLIQNIINWVACKQHKLIYHTSGD